MRTTLALLSALALTACASDPPATEAPAAALPGAPPGYEIPAPVEGVGWRPLEVTFSKTLPGGHDQQVPDESLDGEPTTVDEALADAFEELRLTREALAELAAAQPTGEVPLVEGVVGHTEVPDGEQPPGDIQLFLDPELFSPVTVYNVCTTLTVQCARQAATFDGCLEAVPTCVSAAPWESREDCCPQQCKTDYLARRGAGEEAGIAFMNTFVQDWSCFAGMPGREPHGEPVQGGE